MKKGTRAIFNLPDYEAIRHSNLAEYLTIYIDIFYHAVSEPPPQLMSCVYALAS